MRRGLVAVNTAPDSENTMHGEDAQRYGFASGLVPGVDVLGYLAHGGAETWGSAWLAGGRLDGRLLVPVYDAEAVTVETTPGGNGLDAAVIGGDGGVRATATLSRLDDRARADLLVRADPGAFAIAPTPDPDQRPPVASALLEPGTVLATQWATFDATRASTYLDEISETDAAFRSEGLAHPGWLLRFANWALSRSVRLGPWIHVGSDAFLLDAVRDGDTLEVRAVVTDRYERKGHELVDLTALYLVEDRPVVLVDHRAIWQPRTTG